jgi:hypothetical protein
MALPYLQPDGLNPMNETIMTALEADQAQPRRCRLCVWLLTQSNAAEWHTALANSARYTSTSIARLLRKHEAIGVTLDVVRRHRRDHHDEVKP